MWLCGEVVTMVLLERIVASLPWVRVANLYSVSECHDVAACDLTQWLKDTKVATYDFGVNLHFWPLRGRGQKLT